MFTVTGQPYSIALFVVLPLSPGIYTYTSCRAAAAAADINLGGSLGRRLWIGRQYGCADWQNSSSSSVFMSGHYQLHYEGAIRRKGTSTATF
jgi:hypothetical protein